MFENKLMTLINRVDESLEKVTEEKKTKLYKSLDMDFMEKAKFFEVNSLSSVDGTLDLNTAQFIYQKLQQYDKTSLSERIVLTQVFKELLQKRLVK
jgi:hypothetical protein